MKNLIPYNENCFKVHVDAVNKKHSGDLKDRLLSLNDTIKNDYDIFEHNFSINELLNLIPNPELTSSKEDLLTLYNYNSSVIFNLREKIRNLQIRTIHTTCQFCTIDTVNTLDHILPKSKYPEFIVHPKNLIPCCPTCNSIKTDSSYNENKNEFLNLYLDILPDIQYLFVNISKDENEEIDFSYYLNNVNNKIPLPLYDLIVSHHIKLNLLNRMKLKAREYFDDFKNTIAVFRNTLSIDEIIKHLLEIVSLNQIAYGINNWKCVLELSLLQSSIFKDTFK